MDRQSAVYRKSTDEDWNQKEWDELLDAGCAKEHKGKVRTVRQFEEDAWDRARGSKKNISKAVIAASARGDDPYPYGEPLGITSRAVGLPAEHLYIPWLPDAARLTGYPVYLDYGWNGRGQGGMRVVEGVVGHHTGTPETAYGDYPSLNVVRSGRVGLFGLLSQIGLSRSGAIVIIGNGLAYHAGVSAYAGFYDLNDEFIGIEAEDSGDGQWRHEQLDAYPRLVAALLHYMRRPAERYCSHRTCALPAGRKPDPAGITDAWMHDKVRWMLGDPLNRIPKGSSVPVPQPGTSYPPALPQPFPLPRDHYYGLITGPARSHGGYYDSERAVIKRIQQRLIYKGYVPAIARDQWLSGWADGKFEKPTFDAVMRFQRAQMPGTTRFGEVWFDDYARLAMN